MNRLLKGAAGTIKLTLTDQNEALIDADGAVTAAIVDSAGATVTGSPFTASRVSTGVYQVQVTPANATAIMDTYAVTWSATVSGTAQTFNDAFEVVGGFMFGLASLRAMDAEFLDGITYTSDKLREAREYVEERIEDACGVAFRPRGIRELVDGTGTRDLLVAHLFPTKLVSASVAGVALTNTEIADVSALEEGILRRGSGVWVTGKPRNITVLYEHGFRSTPVALTRAALLAAKAYLLPTNVSAEATTVTTAEGSYDRSRAGRDGVLFGIPDVDVIVAQFDYTSSGRFA